jgi:hypothetical protein
MEQGLSFIGVVGIISVGIALHSSVWVITAFLIGCTYLLWRGKKKGWSWKR